jgi:tRNA(fMet)-specific endonuclease VapC
VRLLVDTNRFADLAANNRAAHERLQSAEEVWISVITVGELRAGFARGNRQQENEHRLSQLLGLQGVGLLLIDQVTTEFYAKIWQSLRQVGQKIPTNDAWIAAQALQHDLILDSRDAHFRLVPQLKLIDE